MSVAGLKKQFHKASQVAASQQQQPHKAQSAALPPSLDIISHSGASLGQLETILLFTVT